MDIGYDAYRFFYYTAKYKSFTLAAKALGNSQPNVTRMIKNLENALGCTLLLRNNRQVELTAEGTVLYSYVRTAFEQLQAGEEALLGGQTLEGGFLRIAATEVALRIFLLPILSQFRSRYPGVHIKLLNGSTPAALGHLESGLADLAFVTTPFSLSESLQSTVLTQVQDVAICGSAYAPVLRQQVTLRQLSEFPLICLGENSGTHQFYVRYFASHGLSFQPDMDAATADQILPMVEANLGIGFVPMGFLSPAHAVHTIALKETLPIRNICMVESSHRIHNRAAKEFRRMCQEFRPEKEA